MYRYRHFSGVSVSVEKLFIQPMLLFILFIFSLTFIIMGYKTFKRMHILNVMYKLVCGDSTKISLWAESNGEGLYIFLKQHSILCVPNYICNACENKFIVQYLVIHVNI